MSMPTIYYASAVICTVSVFIVYLLLRSNLGLALMAIRDDDTAAEEILEKLKEMPEARDWLDRFDRFLSIQGAG